jgi:cytoskeletal protein RodZ
MKILVNNQVALPGDFVYENFNLDFEPLPQEKVDEEEPDHMQAVQNEQSVSDTDTTGQATGTTSTSNQTETEQTGSQTDDTVKSENVSVPHNIHVQVNGIAVTLRNKASYIFVDVLDAYPFDTKVAGGTTLVTRINGEPCDFTAPIKDKDMLDLYWEK